MPKFRAESLSERLCYQNVRIDIQAVVFIKELSPEDVCYFSRDLMSSDNVTL